MKRGFFFLPSFALVFAAACGTATAVPASPPGTPAASVPAETTTAPVAPVRFYAVVLIPKGSTLKARTGPGADNPMTGSLDWDAVNLGATGNSVTVDSAQWVELQLPEGGTGWVERKFLTEYVPPADFCDNSTPPELIGVLGSAVQGREGIALAAISSPVHGLTVTYVHNGIPKVYSPRELESVFDSREVVDWGLGPGSGMPVEGTFHALVAPDLGSVLDSAYSLDCNAILLGGASYAVQWPPTWKNINFYSVYKPGPEGNEMSWMTWLVGIETVDGVPYLFSLSRYNWEP
jgi:hypothetical protein